MAFITIYIYITVFWIFLCPRCKPPSPQNTFLLSNLISSLTLNIVIAYTRFILVVYVVFVWLCVFI